MTQHAAKSLASERQRLEEGPAVKEFYADTWRITICAYGLEYFVYLYALTDAEVYEGSCLGLFPSYGSAVKEAQRVRPMLSVMDVEGGA